MTDCQRHRGPDDQGIALFSLKNAAFMEATSEIQPPSDEFQGAIGFNRLSILDLSINGHQPMYTADRTILMAYNGEVYNAFDYRQDLVNSGYSFRSRSDTEIILYLYEKYGIEGLLDRLNGMFAFVIIDFKSAKIHLVRDHFGIKPLYYALQNHTVFFSSEVKSFLAHPGFSAQIDMDHLDEFLAFRYCAHDRFLMKNVKQVPPGWRLEITADTVNALPYFDIPDCHEKTKVSQTDATDRVYELLSRSVKAQLLSDVKVGCQLSGGIDSSLVTMIARLHQHADLDSFSIVFDDDRFSEEFWISQVASLTKTDNHRFMFQPDYFISNLEKATWHLDQPLNIPNSLGIMMLAQKSRQLVTVLLSGEGADELFGGYSRFYDAAVRQKLETLPEYIHHVPCLGGIIRKKYSMSQSPATAFIMSSMALTPKELKAYRPLSDLNRILEQRRMMFEQAKGDYISNCSKYDMKTYMADLLVRQDKMTMAYSLENRVPFLDRDLVCFVRSLPSEFLTRCQFLNPKAYGRNTKILLKRLAEKKFSRKFVYRLKSGFPLPLETYFRSEKFTALMEELVLPGIKTRGWIDPASVIEIWKNRTDRGQKINKPVWVAVALELWARLFIDRKPVSGLTSG